MKILYSNVIEKNKNWGAEFFLNKAFLALGEKTHNIDYRKYRKVLLYKVINAPLCDIFFLQRGDFFPLGIINSIKIPKVFWASELVRRNRDQDQNFRFGNFDHVFVRGKEDLEIITNYGWVSSENCSILLSAFDQDVFFPIQIEKDIDILFVGVMTPRRIEIIDSLNKMLDITVVNVYGEEFNKYINRSKIILNIHSENYLDTETRVFEVLGAGGFLLTEKLSPENPFLSDELAQFDGLSDLIEKLTFYIKNPEKRSVIASNGYRHAINKHTYHHRAIEILEIFNRLIPEVKNDTNISFAKLFINYISGNYSL